MKKFTLYFLLLPAFVLLQVSCGTRQNSKIATSSSVDSKSLADADTKFILDVNSLLLFNDHLASEAVIRATSYETAMLAESVITSGKKWKEKLASIAEESEIHLPGSLTAEQRDLRKKLVKEKGWMFDRTFAALMDTNLRILHGMFERAEGITDPAVKQLAQTALEDLKIQGELAIAQQEKIKERTGLTPVKTVTEMAIHQVKKKTE